MIHSPNTITAHLTSNQMVKSIQQQESKTHTHYLLLTVCMLTQQENANINQKMKYRFMLNNKV